MIASRIHFVSFLLCLSAALTGIAAEPGSPDAADGTPPQKAASELNPVTNSDDSLSAEMSAAETARVNEIVEEVRQLWQQSPRTPLPAELKTQRSTERIGGYNAWIRAMYANAWAGSRQA